MPLSPSCKDFIYMRDNRFGKEAANGFNIAAHYHKNLATAQIIEDVAKKSSVDVGLFCYDLIQPGQAKEMMDAVVRQFNGIDVLVNTIGPFYYRDILEVTPEEWSD
jgi:NAD(P)-dependent dehydrogenase (short-subunit alcohol dehydrogenase family)